MIVTIDRMDDGVAIQGDSTDPEVVETVRCITGELPLIIADPPYGNVLRERWDRVGSNACEFAAWMVGWTSRWAKLLAAGGAFYVWGGLGQPGFRPFLRYVPLVEDTTNLRLANLITWAKKRAYGVQHNYLYTREELAYFTNGDIKRPRCFNVPLLEAKRGYAGYNKRYPALSEHYRRTNVWSDITEIMRGKVCQAQKPLRVVQVPIEVHTHPGEWIVDPFAGSGTTALAARSLGRRFIVVESDPATYETMIARLHV